MSCFVGEAWKQPPPASCATPLFPRIILPDGTYVALALFGWRSTFTSDAHVPAQAVRNSDKTLVEGEPDAIATRTTSPLPLLPSPPS